MVILNVIFVILCFSVSAAAMITSHCLSAQIHTNTFNNVPSELVTTLLTTILYIKKNNKILYNFYIKLLRNLT